VVEDIVAVPNAGGRWEAKLPGRPWALLAILLVWWAPFFACTSPPDSPEAQIRALIKKAEVAAENKDMATLKDIIAADYKDQRERDKRALSAVLAYELLQHRAIHLLTQIKSIDVSEPGHAQAAVFVAMAGRPVKGLQDLVDLHADLYRVDASFRADRPGDWKLVSADWRQAQIEDLE
jgi:hypothetical protein